MIEIRLTNSSIPPGWVYVPSGNRLRLVDLRTRTVRTVLQAPEPIESFGFCIPASGRSRESVARAVARRADHAHDRRIEAEPRYHSDVFAIPGESQRAALVFWYELADGQAIAEFDQPGGTVDDENIAPRHAVPDRG